MAISEKEKNNILKWDGQKRGHYEVYYLKWNDFESKTAYWVRYTMTSPLPHVGNPYCELWGIFFDMLDSSKNFAVKTRYPIDKLDWDKDRFRVKIADAQLAMNACHGKIIDPKKNYSLEWNLSFDSKSETFYHFPSQRFYTGGFPKTKALSPHVDARFAGKIVANGREINFKDAPGQQTHLWGVKHAHRWAWGHCNAFKEDPGAVWEGLDSQIMLGPIVSPHFRLFYLKTDGVNHYFNTLKHWFGNKGNWKIGLWTFEAQDNEIKIVGEITSKYDDHVAVTYNDPDGNLLWCNNSKVASIKIDVFNKAGSRIKQLTSDHGCAAEYVDRKIYPEVPVRI